MIAFLKKRGVFFSCVLSAGFVMLLAGCGGNGKGGEAGWAPDTLAGRTLQLVPDGVVYGVNPGVVNITQTSASMGIVDKGTKYNQADVVYQKTGPNTASVAFALHVPEPIMTPTTVTYALNAELVFDASGNGNGGVITHWSFIRFSEDAYELTEGEGNSGTCWIINFN